MTNRTETNSLIIVAFHAPTTSGCDYATQTIELLEKNNSTIGFVLGEPITWKDIFLSYRKKSIVEKIYQHTLFRPFFILPGQRIMVIKQMNYFINAMLLNIYVSLFHPQKKKYFWFFEPFFMPIFLPIFSSYITVFDCVDYFFSTQQPFRSHLLYSLHYAKHIFANSIALKNQMQRYRPDVSVVPLGFADRLFRYLRTKKITKHKTLRVGFIGGIDGRIDYSLLFQVATALPNVEFVFIGTNHYGSVGFPPSVKRFFSLPNVHHQEEVAKSFIPEILSTFDIGIIPYNIKQSFNRFCFPMKLLEYFFVGIPVISTNIEEMKEYQDLVIVIKTSQEMILAINRIKEQGWDKKKKLRQRTIALQHSWEHKIRTIQKAIGSA